MTVVTRDHTHLFPTPLLRGLLALVVVLGAVLRVASVPSVKARTPDERVYTAEAVTLLRHGISGIRQLTTDYLNDTERLYPPPSRIGYPAVIAAAMALSGQSDPSIGAWASCAASVAGLMLVAAIGLRVFGPTATVFGTFLLAVFPPDLVIARRAWSDSWVSLLTYALLYAALELTRQRPARWAAPCFVAAGTAFALTKETAAVVWGLCLLGLVTRRRTGAWRIVVVSVFAGVSSLVVLMWCVGGLTALWNILSEFTWFHTRNPYAVEYQDGPAYWLLDAFWITSPLTTTLAVIGLLVVPRWAECSDRPAAAAVAAFSAIFLALPLVLPNWLSLRFASPAFGPLCLLAGGVAVWATTIVRNRTRVTPAICTAVACVILLAGGLRDVRYFQRAFVQTETADLSVKMVFGTAYSKPVQAGAPSALPDNRSATAQTYVNESLQLMQQKRFDEAIGAARQALAIDPRSAVAYNNIAAANEDLAQWDEAIHAAEEALRIDPAFELARNNLAWALAQKAKAAPR